MRSQRRRDVVFYSPWAGHALVAGSRPRGGAEIQVVHLVRGLARRGLRVALATYATPGLPEAIDGVEVIAQWRPLWSWRPARRAVTVATTLAQLLSLDTRVVVQRVAGRTTGLVALAARATGTRFVYSSASTVDFTFDARSGSRLSRTLYTLGLRLAHEIVVQTEEQAQLCRDRFAREPVVIPSVAERAPLSARGPGGFLWIGRLAAAKNPIALTDLAASVPEAPFTMVCVPGDDDDPGVVQALARRAAELPNLELLGPESRPRLLERIARACAVVSTSLSEGMPNPLLEGWSRGVPALTLSHDPDGIIERLDLGHCAHGDPDALARFARGLWTQSAPANRHLRERCRAYVQREHDPDAVLDRWRAVLAGDHGVRPAHRRATVQRDESHHR